MDKTETKKPMTEKKIIKKRRDSRRTLFFSGTEVQTDLEEDASGKKDMAFSFI